MARFNLATRAFGLAILISLHGLADGVLYTWMPRFLESASFQEQPVSPGLVMAGYALAYLSARGFLALLPEWLGKRAFLVWPGIIGGVILFADCCRVIICSPPAVTFWAPYVGPANIRRWWARYCVTTAGHSARRWRFRE